MITILAYHMKQKNACPFKEMLQTIRAFCRCELECCCQSESVIDTTFFSAAYMGGAFSPFRLAANPRLHRAAVPYHLL